MYRWLGSEWDIFIVLSLLSLFCIPYSVIWDFHCIIDIFWLHNHVLSLIRILRKWLKISLYFIPYPSWYDVKSQIEPIFKSWNVITFQLYGLCIITKNQIYQLNKECISKVSNDIQLSQILVEYVCRKHYFTILSDCMSLEI